MALGAESAAGAGGPGVAFGFGSAYRALVAPATAPAGFEQPGFDDSSWAIAPAPFAEAEDAVCPGVFPAPASDFPVGSTIYLRKSFSLPGNAFGLHVVGSVDNDADVYVNGQLEGSPRSGFCHTGAIDLHVPNADLIHGGANLVAVEAVDEGVASFFDMRATYGVLEFGQQPAETQQGSPVAPAPTVTIVDADGSPVSGATVDLALRTIAGSGAFAAGSTTSAVTDSSGVATFSDVAITGPGEYELVATSEGATATSLAFVIANEIEACHGSRCSASGSVPNTTQTDVSASNAPDGSSLAVSVIPSTTPPPGVCAGLAPLGAGSFVNVLGAGSGALPDLTVTWRLDKDLVKQAGNPGAAHFDICLGAENLLDPAGSSTTGWQTKDGVPAVGVPDPDLGVTLFWGILPDCGKHPTGPCVLHRNKNKGDEVVEFLKPAPWDGHVFGG